MENPTLVIGIFMMSISIGAMAYIAAIIFALGVTYYWPNMLGFTAEKIPLSGAIGLSIVGAMGMFSTSIFQPIIGTWIDNARVDVAAMGLVGDAAELAVGQTTLQTMISFPAILVVMFIILIVWNRKLRAKTAAAAETTEN